MDGVGKKSWKVKRDNVTQQFEKLQEDLERMDEFDAWTDSKINMLKTLTRRFEAFPLASLGEQGGEHPTWRKHNRKG
jgi:hypothetical protein